MAMRFFAHATRSLDSAVNGFLSQAPDLLVFGDAREYRSILICDLRHARNHDDEAVASRQRTLLVECANHVLGPHGRDSTLRQWGLHLASRGGKQSRNRAIVAVARKLAVLLHRIWITLASADRIWPNAANDLDVLEAPDVLPIAALCRCEGRVAFPNDRHCLVAFGVFLNALNFADQNYTTPLAGTYHLFQLNADLRVIRKDIGHLTFSGEAPETA
jgi:hypothetical protein